MLRPGGSGGGGGGGGGGDVALLSQRRATAADTGAAERAGLPLGSVGRALLVAGTFVSFLLAANALLLLRARNCPAVADVDATGAASGGPGPPPGLAHAQFSPSLGCWHNSNHSSKLPPRLHVVSLIDGQQWATVRDALLQSAVANDRLRWVLVTPDAALPAAAASELAALPRDLWFCPEVLLSTLLAIGAEYAGPKLLISPDTLLPVVPNCRFKSTRGYPVMYVVARGEAPGGAGCSAAAKAGAVDGLMYASVPEGVAQSLRFAWEYAGAGNIALKSIQDAGFKLANLCPHFEPRRRPATGAGRNTTAVRIGDPSSRLHGGKTLSAEVFARLCSAAPTEELSGL